MPNPPATPQDDDAYYRAVLHELIEGGLELARTIRQQATEAPPADGSTPDPTIAYDRIARAIRRTIALARHIAEGPPPPRRASPNPDRTATRARILRDVEDAIHRRRDETDELALREELLERLDDPALEFDLHNRPVEDVIDEICRDLGVARPGLSCVWQRRTPQDIADLRTRAAAPPGAMPALPPPPHLVLRTHPPNGIGPPFRR